GRRRAGEGLGWRQDLTGSRALSATPHQCPSLSCTEYQYGAGLPGYELRIRSAKPSLLTAVTAAKCSLAGTENCRGGWSVPSPSPRSTERVPLAESRLAISSIPSWLKSVTVRAPCVALKEAVCSVAKFPPASFSRILMPVPPVANPARSGLPSP